MALSERRRGSVNTSQLHLPFQCVDTIPTAGKPFLSENARLFSHNGIAARNKLRAFSSSSSGSRKMNVS